ncbi:hypothetical protein F5B17DRAFT_315699 [Nemania serpens]|nr:hypothetical protein F5B17DRAFT_315699 [Nemania serpens]
MTTIRDPTPGSGFKAASPPSSPTVPPSFCQAIVFFYTCGCRDSQPVFCCRPPTELPGDTLGSPQSHPCQHENPALLVAKLPHACRLRIGNSEACGAEDPGAKEFIREVDTAERLELAVVAGVAKEAIDHALPGKVEGEFTAHTVASKYQRRRSSGIILKPTAAPFIPRPVACVATGTLTVGEGVRVACGDGVDTANDTSMTNTKLEADGEHWQEAKSEDRQNDIVLATETPQGDAGDAAMGDGTCDNHGDSSEELFDVDLSDSTPEPKASIAEHTAKEEKPESGPPAMNIEVSYDELAMLWALDRKTKLKKSEDLLRQYFDTSWHVVLTWPPGLKQPGGRFFSFILYAPRWICSRTSRIR